MGRENYIIQVSKHCSRQRIKMIIDQIRRWNGEILAQFPQRFTVIVAIESDMREQIEAMPQVNLVGGIQIQPKPVRRIQVRQSDSTERD